MTITVRQASFADLPAMAVLFDKYRQFQGQAENLAAARQFLRERFDHGESVAFIAHDDSDAVGFAQLYPIYSSVSLARVFVLNDLFVDAAARHKGVATDLLQAVESYAWELGAARVTLNVAKTNFSAQELYDRRGWQRDAQFCMYHRFPPAPVTSSGGVSETP